jgi:hypothetical protein
MRDCLVPESIAKSELGKDANFIDPEKLDENG